MRYGIITLSRGSLELAEKIESKLPGSIIYSRAERGFNRGKIIDCSLEEFVGKIFNKHDTLIFIMAAGIVVRVISGHIVDKTADPGILVIDEKGKFVISLLSGHIGGANDTAEIVAEKIGAVPVITTSSDVLEKISVDMLALELNCSIDSMEWAKKITSMIVNDEKVVLLSDIKCDIPHYLRGNVNDAKGLIIITNKKNMDQKRPYARLIPKNITIGIGCRRDTPADKILDFINKKFNELNLDTKSIKNFATVEIKKDEPGIKTAVDHFNSSLIIYSIEEIKSVEDKFAGSDFVKGKTGVAAVCEPCAYLATGKRGHKITGKEKSNGITLSIWEEK